MSLKAKHLFLSILSGILLIMAWPAYGFAGFLFIGFVPLLLLEKHFLATNGSSSRLFGLSYLTFLTWNLGTTWWVYEATFAGSVMAFAFNSLFMCGFVTLSKFETCESWLFWLSGCRNIYAERSSIAIKRSMTIL